MGRLVRVRMVDKSQPRYLFGIGEKSRTCGWEARNRLVRTWNNKNESYIEDWRLSLIIASDFWRGALFPFPFIGQIVHFTAETSFGSVRVTFLFSLYFFSRFESWDRRETWESPSFVPSHYFNVGIEMLVWTFLPPVLQNRTEIRRRRCALHFCYCESILLFQCKFCFIIDIVKLYWKHSSCITQAG